MIYISHRGNVDGPDKELENSPGYIKNTLCMGFHVEVDVWLVGSDFYLGHDYPKYKTTKEFLSNERFLCHCKNVSSLESLLENGIHCFSHESDSYAFTSRGFVISHPGLSCSSKKLIIMKPEFYTEKRPECFGVCSDYIYPYREKYENEKY